MTLPALTSHSVSLEDSRDMIDQSEKKNSVKDIPVVIDHSEKSLLFLQNRRLHASWCTHVSERKLRLWGVLARKLRGCKNLYLFFVLL